MGIIENQKVFLTLDSDVNGEKYFKALISEYLRRNFCRFDGTIGGNYDFCYSLFRRNGNTIEQIDKNCCRIEIQNATNSECVNFDFMWEIFEDENDQRFSPNNDLDQINILITPTLSIDYLIDVIKDNTFNINYVFYTNYFFSDKDTEIENIKKDVVLVSKMDVDAMFEKMYGKSDREYCYKNFIEKICK
jgi:ribosome-interacting GTPase 1